jgi:hypothetical protein
VLATISEGSAVPADPREPVLSTASASTIAGAWLLEMTFQALAGIPYHLWIRLRADRDFYGNDSLSVQVSDSVTASGAATTRIGSTSAATVILEDGSNAVIAGWGWQDNGYGIDLLGPDIYFAQSGTHTIRVQRREDGVAIDQIVLSAGRFLHAAPGAVRNDATIVAR